MEKQCKEKNGIDYDTKPIERIKEWLIRHHAIPIIMALNVITLIALLYLELKDLL